MKVRVYRNLRNGKLSVQRYRKGKGWRLWKHTEHITLTDVVFKVYENRRQEVLRTGHKNVHAFVIGWFGGPISHGGFTRPVVYNPRKFATFVDRDTLTPIHAAPVAEVHADGPIWTHH